MCENLKRDRRRSRQSVLKTLHRSIIEIDLYGHAVEFRTSELHTSEIIDRFLEQGEDALEGHPQPEKRTPSDGIHHNSDR